MEQKTDYLVRGHDVACNINVYEKNRVLYVRFDILSNQKDNTEVLKLKNIGFFATEYAAEPLEYDDIKKEGSTELMDKDILGNLLGMQKKVIYDVDPLDHLFYKRTKPNEFFTHIEITYKLPVIPHILINWITCLAICINQNLRRTHFQLGDHNVFKNMDIHTDINGLVSGKSEVHVILELMKRIVAFKSFEPKLKRYGTALKDLEKLHSEYLLERDTWRSQGRVRPKTLIQCVSDQNRCNMLYDRQFKKISKTESPREKTASIVSMAMSMVSKRYECLFMFELMNAKSRLLFIASCFGKKAHNGEKYDMRYTELSLLYFAEFELLPDGRMAIVNLDKNPAYLAYYAEGKHNFKIFHEEFVHWSKCVDLEIEPGLDLHNEKAMIFTLPCTPKLTALDLHLNSHYCKTLFNVYNTWAFYTRIALADNNFNKLAKETLDQVILETNPSFKWIRESHNQGFFHAVQMGKERGEKEYADVVKSYVQTQN